MEGDAKQAYDFAKESRTQIATWVQGDPELTDFDREELTCAQNSLNAAIAAAGVRAGRWTEEEARELLMTHATSAPGHLD